MKCWICCFAFFITLTIGLNDAWANDPFDKTQRDHAQITVTKNDETSIETDEPLSLCTSDENRQAAEVPLNALKLAGVVISKDQAFALFVDNAAQLYLVPEGADIAQEGYWLEKVNKNHVQLMRKRGATCNQTETKQLSF